MLGRYSSVPERGQARLGKLIDEGLGSIPGKHIRNRKGSFERGRGLYRRAWLSNGRFDARHRPLPSRLASAAHSRPLREAPGHHHDHELDPHEPAVQISRCAFRVRTLIHPLGVGDGYRRRVRWGSDSVSRSRRRSGAKTGQHEHRYNFAPSRSGGGFAAMTSHRLPEADRAAP